MKATPQYQYEKAVFGNTEGLEDQAMPQCFFECHDEDRFKDLQSPGSKTGIRAARNNILASGDPGKILKYYTELYYNRLENGLNPVYENAGEQCGGEGRK